MRIPKAQYLDLMGNFNNATGSNYNDTIKGTSATNIIDGNGGNDIIWSHGGGDTIKGGSGSDTLVFTENVGDFKILMQAPVRIILHFWKIMNYLLQLGALRPSVFLMGAVVMKSLPML